MTIVNQYLRLALVVRVANGTPGRRFNIGVDVPAPAQLPAIDTVSQAAVIEMNQQVSGAIAIPGVDKANYFYPFEAGQTQAELSVSFTANQQVERRLAQKTGPGTYVLQPATLVALTQSGKTDTAVSPNPANATGTSTP